MIRFLLDPKLSAVTLIIRKKKKFFIDLYSNIIFISMIITIIQFNRFNSKLINRRERDEKKKPNIGRILFFPYARILPMHLTIMFGGSLMNSGWTGAQVALIFFLLLKTVADIMMHMMEHAEPRKK